MLALFAVGEVMGADSDAGGPTAGPRSTPPFPGQDFIMPPVSLIGYQAVVSIEPDPDDSPGVSVQLEHDSPEVKIRTWKKELS